MINAYDFLKIKQKICTTHKHCIKCEFYYACIQISNATDKEIMSALGIAEKMKELERK